MAFEASTRGRPQALFAIKPTRTHVEWLWRVSERARSAGWRLRVTCGKRHASVLLTIRGHRTGVHVFARTARIFEFGSSFSFAGHRASAKVTPAWAQTTARKWWTTQGATILSDFNMGSSLGQCTAYAAGRRPDIVAGSTSGPTRSTCWVSRAVRWS